MTPERTYSRVEDDPGVPEALGQALEVLVEKLGARPIGTLWLFPPLRSGRREHGLICAALDDAMDGDRQLLVTLAYRAEETGKGVEFHSRFTEEGEAPPERLPVVIEGVVRRADAGSGEPRRVPIERDPERVDSLLVELGREPPVRSTDAHASGDSRP